MNDEQQIPEEVERKFLDRLKAALRGDDQAADEIGEVLGQADSADVDEAEQKGLFAKAIGFVSGAAENCWQTATSWSRLSQLATEGTQQLLIETVGLAFKTVLVAPLGTKFTGDTATVAAIQIKAALYYLNGWEVPAKEQEAWSEYVEETKAITGYLSTLGLRAGLFALPGIGAIASATIGKYLEEKIRESFPEDPEIIEEIKAMMPK